MKDLVKMKIYMSVAFTAILLFAALPSYAEEIKVRGIRVGAPSDPLSDSEGGINGSIGYLEFSLNYQRRLNYYFTGSLATDLFTDSNEKDSATEVDDRPENVDLDAETASYRAVFLSAGGAFNFNNFDNIILFAGPAISFGDTLVQDNSDNYFLIDDLRFGLMAGVTVAFEKVFVALDYSSLTESPALTISYAF